MYFQSSIVFDDKRSENVYIMHKIWISTCQHMITVCSESVTIHLSFSVSIFSRFSHAFDISMLEIASKLEYIISKSLIVICSSLCVRANPFVYVSRIEVYPATNNCPKDIIYRTQKTDVWRNTFCICLSNRFHLHGIP